MAESWLVRARRRFVTRALMPRIARLLPRLGETERIALEAGTVWWDGELFSGTPDWEKLLDFQPPPLSRRGARVPRRPGRGAVRACSTTGTIHQQRDLPPEIWDVHQARALLRHDHPEGVRRARLLRARALARSSRKLVEPPRDRGGHGDGAELARARRSCCCTTAPTSRSDTTCRAWRRGEEIPCFALTGPEAGSRRGRDAVEGHRREAARGEGKEVLGMRLNWNKRYITLAPVATLIGLAFRLHDPDQPARRRRGSRHHLRADSAQHARRRDRPAPRSDGRAVPERPDRRQRRVRAARRASSAAAMARAGLAHADGVPRRRAARSRCRRSRSARRSWRRASAAPTRPCASSSTRRSAASRASRSRSRASPALTYMMNAARTLTCGALDAGEKPAVLSAIVQGVSAPRRCASVVNDAMDIRAGAAIQRGPRNIARARLSMRCRSASRSRARTS